MNEDRLYQVLISPHISEKGTLAAEKSSQIVFKVLPSATKTEIKAAVEKLFEVEVDRVQVLNVMGKRKSMGRIAGVRSNWKKAYVKLKPGHDIDFLDSKA